MEQVANEFEASGAPAVFLEQDLNRPVGVRLDRFDAAVGTQVCAVPWVIVDSGWGHSCGRVDYANEYRRMVTEALSQPPLAELEGSYVRIGDDLRVDVRLTNRTGRTLSFSSWTTVNVIVYERVRVIYTTRTVRGATQTDLDGNLIDGATASLHLIVPNVPVEDWDKAHVIALADYRPEPTQARFVSLQAVELHEPGPPPTAPPLPTFPPGSPRLHLPIGEG